MALIKKPIALLLTIVMLMGIMSMAVTATGETGTNVFEASKRIDKTADGLDADDFTNVTLTVPGEKIEMSSDIVLVVGEGSALKHEYFVELIHDMLTAADGTPTKIKVGLVTFGDTTEQEIVLPLSEMIDTVPGNTVKDFTCDVPSRNSGESKEAYFIRIQPVLDAYEARIAAAIAENPALENDMDLLIAKALHVASLYSNGVNLNSALITARDMLLADEEVPAERKHMIVFSTGLTYTFDDVDGNFSVTIREESSGGKAQFVNFKYWQSQRHNSTSGGYKIPAAYVAKHTVDGVADYKAAYLEYWEDIVEWIEKDQNSYVYTPGTLNEDGTFTGDTFTAFSSRLDSSYRLKEPDVSKITGKAPVANTLNPLTNANAQHAVGYERAQYEAYLIYKQMETPIGENVISVLKDEEGNNIVYPGLGFNCYALAAGKTPAMGEDDLWLQDNQIGYNFMFMMGGENAANFRSGDATFFENIASKILYTCADGSTVTDYMGYDEVKGDFNFVQDYPMTLVYGGETYTAEKLDETKEGATASYGFNKKADGTYSFNLDYYDGEADTEHFIWTFHENVSMEKVASLTYRLKLTNKAREVGVYTIETNEYAVLKPIDTKHQAGDWQYFPVPTVEYTTRAPIHILGSIFVNKVTDGATTPEDATFQLQIQNGQDWINVGEAVPFSAFVNNAYTFTDLAEGTYRVVETGAEIEEFRLTTTSAPVTLTKTTADNGDTIVSSERILVINAYDPFVHTLGSIFVNKVTDGATTPADATFQLQIQNGQDWINVGEAVPFSAFVNNVYIFTDLEEGTYRVVETGAEIEEFRLTTTSAPVTLTKTTADNGDTIVSSERILVINAYDPFVHTLGSVVVNKVTTGATTPAGATFQLQKLNGETWTNVGEAVPFSAFVNNAYTFTDLAEGTYRVVEAGAEIEEFRLVTTYGENVVLTKTTADNGNTSINSGSILVTNTYDPFVHTLGSIDVNKVTNGATTPAGATFQLQKLNGETWTDVGEAVPFSAFVNNAYTFTNLEEGTYRVVETGAEIEGFRLATTSDPVTLTKTTAENGNTSINSERIVVTNTYDPFVHTLGSIVVNKVTTGATTPAGATFQLQKLNGETWTNVGEAVPFSAFVNNVYTFTDLEEGTYRVVETGAEIEEFRLVTTYGENVVLTKTTADNGDTSINSGSILVTNTYDPFVHTLGSIVVNKVTTGATTPAGATFQLQKLNGETWTNVGEAVPFSAFVNNAYTFTNLEEGTYRVVEAGAEIEDSDLTTVYSADVVLTKTTAENGDTSVSNGNYTVTNSYELTEIPDEDVPLGDKPPKTGDAILPFFGMAFASGAAAIFVGKTGKKEDEE